MHKDFFEFKLDDSLNGDIKELILYAPRSIHRPLMGKIDSMVMNGMMRFQGSEKSEKMENEGSSSSENPFDAISAQELVTMLKAVPSETYDFFTIFCDTFKALILSPHICKIKHNNMALGNADFDKMSYRDADRMMGEYLKNFFTFSASS